MSQRIDWASHLSHAATFEAAADQVAQQALEVLCEALDQTGVRPLRTMVHLRPDGGYTGLRWAERVDAGDATPNLTPSSTAWLVVRKHAEPVVINLTRKTYATSSGSAHGDLTLLRRRNGDESIQLMRDRLATHLLAVPLYSADRSIVGMLSVEVNAMHALRELDLFGDVPAVLSNHLEGVGPALSVLPNAPLPPPNTDQLLPVAGPSMARTLATLERFARLDNTLLLVGETGVGKTELVEWIVARSGRADRPVIRMHVAGQSAEKLEGELFGWTRGSFTGALSDRHGLVACAEGGTLVLDEVDKLPLDAQACLLQLLGSRSYRRRGDNRDQIADVRFILASNAHLPDLVDEGRFSPELYFRVAALEVRVPSLDQRRDEIGAWATWLARRAFGQVGRSVKITREARSQLRAAQWPGNLRQLESVVIRAGAAAEMDGTAERLLIDVQHLPGLQAPRPPAGGSNLDQHLQRAAAAILDQLQLDEPLADHTVLDALKGYVVEEAVSRHGRADAAKMLGRAAMLRGGNHHTWIDSQTMRADRLRALLGGIPID